MAKRVKALELALTSDTGNSTTDLVTYDGRVAVQPISNGDLINYRMSSDGGTTWTEWAPAVSRMLPPPGEDGAWIIQVQEVKKNGAEVDNATLSFTLDTHAAPPGITLQDDTGESSDRITSDATLNVGGIEPGGKAQYSTDGSSWSDSFTAQDGPNDVLVRQVDLAGNVSAASSLSFVLDTTAPVALDDHFVLDVSQHSSVTTGDVLANDSDPDGTLTYSNITKVDPAGHGVVEDNQDGTFTYTPDSNFIGVDSFNYILSDAAGNLTHGTVTIDVNSGGTPENHPPVVDAPLHAWALPSGAPVAIYALQNAWDVDGNPLEVVGLPAALPDGVAYDPTTATFTFDPGATTQATVAFSVSDGSASTPTSVSFTVADSPFIPYDLQNGDLQNLTDALTPDGNGIVIDSGSISLVAGSTSVNFYDGSLAALGIGAGLLVTSGTTPPPVNTLTWFGEDNSMPGDPALDAVVNTVFHTQPNSYDATMLGFSFTVSDPTATSVSFDLVFGSDEYPEWVDQYVDCAIVTVNDVNVALFGHDTLTPLSVITPNLSAGYFIDNADGHLPIEYDGVSHALKIVAPIHEGVNSIVIGIGDTGDHIYDSGMFIANLAAGDAPGSGVVIPVDPPPPGPSGGSEVHGTSQDEYIPMTDGDDTVYAGSGDDIVLAKGGSDLVYGEDGEDAISGGSGNDTLYGGNQEDELVGGGGNDILVGGDGTDTFVYERLTDAGPTGDTIQDFVAGPGGEKLELHDLLLEDLRYAGNDPIGDGYVGAFQDGADTLIRIDPTGGANSFSIVLVTLQNVNASVFGNENLIA